MGQNYDTVRIWQADTFTMLESRSDGARWIQIPHAEWETIVRDWAAWLDRPRADTVEPARVQE